MKSRNRRQQLQHQQHQQHQQQQYNQQSQAPSSFIEEGRQKRSSRGGAIGTSTSTPSSSASSSSSSSSWSLISFCVVLLVLLLPTIVFVARGGVMFSRAAGDVAVRATLLNSNSEISKVFNLKNLGNDDDDDDDDDDEKDGNHKSNNNVRVETAASAAAAAAANDDDEEQRRRRANAAAISSIEVTTNNDDDSISTPSSSSYNLPEFKFLLPTGSAPARVVHVVSFSHWDVEWYTGFQFMRRQLLHSLDRVTQAMKDSASNRYFSLDGQSVVAEDYLEMRGAHTEQGRLARELLRSGRLVAGPLYTQPDEFQASPEALLRNLYYGKHLKREYGQRFPPDPTSSARAQVSFLDQFGHVGQLPRMLREHGIDVFFTARGLRAGKQAMLWRGTDGSVVLVAYIIGWYCNGKDMENQINSWQSTSKGERSSGRLPPASIVAQLRRAYQQQMNAAEQPTQLLIMYGCDHSMPDRHFGSVIDGLNQALNSEGTLVVASRLEDYAGLLVRDLFRTQNVSRIEDLRLEWANSKQSNRQARAVSSVRETAAGLDGRLRSGAVGVVGQDTGELNQELPLELSSGEMRTDVSNLLHVTSSVILQKQDNYRCQTLLERYGEPLQALLWASHPQHAYENETLWYAWKLALRNHAHDSIGGCSATDVHYDVAVRLKNCKRTAGQVAGEALLSLSKLVRAHNEAAAAAGDEQLSAGVPRQPYAEWDEASGRLRVLVYNALPYRRSELVVAPIWFTGSQKPQADAFVSRRGYVRVVRVEETSAEFKSDKAGGGQENDDEVALEMPAIGLKRSVRSNSWAFFIPEKGGFRYPYQGFRASVAFLARDVPPVGYATFAIMFGGAQDDESLRINWPPLAPKKFGDDAHLPSSMPEGLPPVLAVMGDGSNGARVLIHKDGSVSMREPLTDTWLHDLNIFGDQHSRGSLYQHAGGGLVRTARNDPQARLELVKSGDGGGDGFVDDAGGVYQTVRGKLSFADVQLEVRYVLPYGRDEALRVRVLMPRGMNGANHRLTVGFDPSPLSSPRILADGSWEVRAPFSTGGADPNVLRDFVDISGQICKTQTACLTVGVGVAPRGLQEYDVRGDGSVAIAMLRGNDVLGDWTAIRVPSGQELDEEHAWEYAIAVHAGSVDPARDFNAQASGEAQAFAPAADDTRRSALTALAQLRGFQAPLVPVQALEWRGLVGLYTPLSLDATADFILHHGEPDQTTGGGQGESVSSQSYRASPRKPLPARGSFVQLEPGYLALSALKKVETRDELLIRFYNPYQTTVKAKITLDLRMLRANYFWRREQAARKAPSAAVDVQVRRCLASEEASGLGDELKHVGDASSSVYLYDRLELKPADVVTLCVRFPHRPRRVHLKAYHSGDSSEWSEREDWGA